MSHIRVGLLLSFVLASSADAAMTGIYRTGTGSGSIVDSLTAFASISTLASNSPIGSPVSLSPTIAGAKYTCIFGDFVQGQATEGYLYRSVYDTTSGRVSQIIRYVVNPADALANFRANNGTTFNLVTPGGGGWDREDDMFADGLGNYYRNRTANGGSNGVTKYGSFLDFVNDTNGTTYNYTATYGFNDRFFAFEGKFYRTNTGGSGGSVSSFATYNSFSDLVSGTVASTTNSVNWSQGDIYIPVPAPGAMALLGLAGAFGARRARR